MWPKNQQGNLKSVCVILRKYLQYISNCPRVLRKQKKSGKRPFSPPTCKTKKSNCEKLS